MTTWKELISDALKEHNEKWSDIISITLTDDQLNIEFDNGYGITEGLAFTAWTKKRVYFPRCYDGAEDCDSVSRNPDGIPTTHIGGG